MIIKTFMKSAAILPTSLTLLACSPTLVRLPVPFDQEEAANLLKPGNNQITGAILYEPDRGKVLGAPATYVSCAGRAVSLIPYTDYAREWALRFYGKPVTDTAYRLTHRGKSMTFEGEDAFMAASRKTECDKDGRFAFNNVADGDFLVVADVQWTGKYQSYGFGLTQEDMDVEEGSVVKKISLSGGTKQVLTGPWP
jgi:hypothetical protein